MDFTNYKFDLQRSPLDTLDFMLESIHPEEVILPEEWDLRPHMRAIRDQGNQGTCSAQTAAAMKEWQEHADVQLEEWMSPQFVYNLRENQGTSGMYPRDTMNILYKTGIVKETDYPYNTFTPISEELKQKATMYKIQGYAQINTIDSLKKALFANGPCYIAFGVYNPNKMEFWKPDYAGQPALGGHAVCVAGFLKDCFIIRNSWSAGWGDQGYCYYYFKDFGLHWEIWTSTDILTDNKKLIKKSNDFKLQRKRKHIFAKLFKKRIKN
jgi:C1A family cysteine protease